MVGQVRRQEPAGRAALRGGVRAARVRSERCRARRRRAARRSRPSGAARAGRRLARRLGRSGARARSHGHRGGPHSAGLTLAFGRMTSRSVAVAAPAPGAGQHVVVVATRAELAAPSAVSLPAPEPAPGLILADGSINWGCPCLGGMATGPCGNQFRDAFSCFHYSEADPKGSECYDKFSTMQSCMAQYPALYGRDDDELAAALDEAAGAAPPAPPERPAGDDGTAAAGDR